MFWLGGSNYFYDFAVYYVGASEVTPHRGLKGAEIVLASGRRKGGFGARRNVGKGGVPM